MTPATTPPPHRTSVARPQARAPSFAALAAPAALLTLLHALGQASPTRASEPMPITVTVVGDINFAGFPETIAPFDRITDLLKSDLRIANAEGLLTSSTPIPRYREARLDIGASPSFVHHFRHFDLVGLANNHTWDAGSEGLLEHLTHFENQDIRTLGADRAREAALAPARYLVRESRLVPLTITPASNAQPAASAAPCLSVFATSLKSNRRPRPGAFADIAPDEATRESLLARIASEHARGCFVLVSLHAGREGRDGPDAPLRAFGHRLLDAGADLIAAHHPHVLQGVELRRTPGRAQAIAWSLGNLLFRNRAPEKRQSGILRAALAVSPEGRLALSGLDLLLTHSDGAHLPRPATPGEARAIARRLEAISERYGVRPHLELGPPSLLRFLP